MDNVKLINVVNNENLHNLFGNLRVSGLSFRMGNETSQGWDMSPLSCLMDFPLLPLALNSPILALWTSRLIMIGLWEAVSSQSGTQWKTLDFRSLGSYIEKYKSIFEHIF